MPLLGAALESKNERMFAQHWFWFWIIGLIVVSVWLLASRGSKEARLEKRRRKSHSRIISKTSRPSVKFSVKAPPDKSQKKKR